MLGYGMGIGLGDGGAGVLQTSGNADAIPELSLCTTDLIFTFTVTPIQVLLLIQSPAMIISQAGVKFAVFLVCPLLQLSHLLNLNVIKLVILEI
jgi:hypothetical protein